MKTETLNDVPATQLETLTRQWELAGGSVVAIRQGDGRWTVVATFTEKK